MKKVALINEGNSSNFGDTVINMVLETYFRERGYDTDHFNFSKVEPKDSQDYCNKKSRKSYIFNGSRSFVRCLKYFIPIPNRYKWILKNFYKLIMQRESYKFVVIGGGQLLNGGNFTFSLFYWTAYFWFRRIPVYVMNVGCGGRYSSEDKRLLLRAQNRIEKITVRDQVSSDYLIGLGVKNITVIPDPAFLVSDIYSHTKLTFQGRNIVTVFPASYLHVVRNLNEYNGTLERYYEYFLQKLEPFLTCDIVISYSDYVQDKHESENFYRWLNDRNRSIRCELKELKSVNDYLSLIFESSVVISSRLHPLIIAKSFGRRHIAIEINRKIKGFHDILNYKSLNDIRSEFDTNYRLLFSGKWR